MPQLIRPPGILSRARRPIEPWELPWITEYWDGSIGVTITGGVADQWDPIKYTGSAHPFTATLTARPAASGGVLTFDGSNDTMATGAFTLSQPLTYFMVVRQDVWSTGWLVDGSTTFSVGVSGNTGTPKIRAYAGSGSSDLSSLAVGTWGILAIVYNGASSSFQHNLNTAITGNFGAANAGKIVIGSANGGANYACAFQAFAYATAALSAAQITQTVQAMGRRYGIAV